jgi:excisionase family DNA binding protein
MNEPLLTARDVSAYLSVSTNTVLDWWERGDLPGFKLNGRAVRFRPAEIEAWLEQQRRGPTSPGVPPTANTEIAHRHLANFSGVSEKSPPKVQ